MKRPWKRPDCFRALRVSDALIYGGFGCALLGCGVGYWDGPRLLAGVLVLAYDCRVTEDTMTVDQGVEVVL